MTRFIMPIILIGISITVFFTFTNPIYNDISLRRADVATYTEALNNEKSLEVERDKLTAKENAIDKDNLIKLQKLLPENVDNIRLILEIEQIGLPYGMALKDVKYSATTTTDTTKVAMPGGAAVVQGGGIVAPIANKDYGTWELAFSTTGTYNNFLNFIRDLESNLRIVDISSIAFSSNSNTGLNPSLPQSYKYDFKIKTYWLKN